MKQALYRYFFSAFAIASISATEKSFASSSAVHEYLSRQLRDTKVEIAKSYSQDPPEILSQPYDPHWKQIWHKSVDSDTALTVSFWNETFVLANDRVLRVEVEITDNVKLRQVALISQYKPVKFVRSTENKGSLFLLICQEDGSCNLNVGPNAHQLHHWQIIKNRGLIIDAEFFSQMNQLYLIIADNSGQFAVSSVIYHWTGTYMDVVAEITTTGAVSVTTFNYKQSTIIVFAQNVQSRPRIGSEVFRFKNGIVEKIQFLPTDGPMSVHRYQYDGKTFLLVINEFSASKVFWWAGKEFLNWMELPEIKSPTKVDIVYADGETLLLVSQQSTFSLYKIMNLVYTELDLLEMKDGYAIVDFSARVKGKSIILVLVTKSEGTPYRIEPFELVIRKFSEVTIDEPDGALHYLTQLDQLLKDRMSAIDEAYESWPKLLPFAENLVISSPFEIDELIIESGSISEIFVRSRAEIMTPTELESGLEQIDLVAESLLSRSSEFLFLNDTAQLTGTISVDGNAFFDELHVDALNVSVLNDRKVELEDFISYAKDQDFAQPLRGGSITIENLEIDSICGIPFENWMRTGKSDQTAIEFLADNVSVFKDTIFIQGDLSLDNIGVSVLNNLNMTFFINDLFIIGLNQNINGNIFYKQGLNAYNLTINVTNGINADQLLTKNTNQKLTGNFFIKTLDVDDLFVSTINDVPVNEAARISKENLILGQVTFRKLVVTEEFSVQDNVSVRFDIRPIQVYEDVEINGDLTLEDLILPSGSSLYLNDRKVDLDYLFANYWTKSTDQTIPKSVTLVGGITIDDLHSEYLNGYREEDFLFTTAEEIPEKFGTLYFKRLEIDGMLFLEDADQSPAESFFLTPSKDTLVVNQKILIKNLTVGNLNAKSYNKIPIEYIVSGRSGAKVPGHVKYENLFVNGEMKAREVTVNFLNGKDLLSGFFAEVLYRDGNYAIDYFEVEKLFAENVGLEVMNDLDMGEFHKMLIYKDVTKVRNITVDGDLEVIGNLQVEFINDLTSAEFIDKLATEDVLLGAEQSTFKSFAVFGNLQANLLRGIKIEDVVANTLSRTKPQTIRGQFSFGKVQANYLSAPKINNVDVTSLKLVSDPLIIQEDVIFSHLIVQGDVITSHLNSLDVYETYVKALSIPLTDIKSLTIKGRIFWENSFPSESNSFSYLFENAVTKNRDQTIHGEVIFADNVEALRLAKSGSALIGGVDISSVVSDAVLYNNDGDETVRIRIAGEKYLGEGLTVSELTVSGDVGFRSINNWDILLINSTIVRKFDRQTVAGTTIFHDEISIEKLEVEGRVHGLDTGDIATFSSSLLPKNTRFAYLEVKNELRTQKLDGIELEEFIRKRITLDGDHDVYDDVVFQDSIAVTQNAAVTFINEIEVSDLVLSGDEKVQLISGEKIFLKDFTLRGNVIVGSINDVRVTEEYRNGVFNNEYVHIKGDIIVSSDFETQSNVSVSELINGIKLSDLLYGDVSAEAKAIMERLEHDQLSIDGTIDRSLNATSSLPDVFFYFDTQRELVIRAPNIKKVQTFATESITRLNLYGFEGGQHCGLPNVCLCPAQYVAELLDYECKIWKVSGARTVYNFHDPDGRFGVNVVSNGVSSSKLCTQAIPDAEFIKISWIVPGQMLTGHLGGKITNKTIEINGYLSDAKAFTIGAEIYLVLAIYYNAVVKSHNIYSPVYRINLITGEIELAQKILTSGAIALEVFTTRLRGTHLLVACASDPAESKLYRFNARDSKFELLRTFWTGGSLNVKSLIHGEESFVLLDDPPANSIHIFKYNIHFDNYNFYQSIFQNSLVKNIEVFYSGEIHASDAYVIVTTEEGRFFVYEYMFFGGFQLRFEQWLDGVQTMAPFYYSGHRYIFTGTITNSTVYRIVQQGPISNWYN